VKYIVIKYRAPGRASLRPFLESLLSTIKTIAPGLKVVDIAEYTMSEGTEQKKLPAEKPQTGGVSVPAAKAFHEVEPHD
jgi:hypothetical protein